MDAINDLEIISKIIGFENLTESLLSVLQNFFELKPMLMFADNPIRFL